MVRYKVICKVRYIHSGASQMKATPTAEQYDNYQAAYDYFNAELFGGRLKPCLLNIARGRKFRGFFWAERFTHSRRQKAIAHEIAMNPDHFDRPLEDIFSTLVHEMCHQWQQDFGHP